jgi:hypothetical protein
MRAHLYGDATAPVQMNAAAKKKEKILAKMKALQSQILGDFKKVKASTFVLVK